MKGVGKRFAHNKKYTASFSDVKTFLSVVPGFLTVEDEDICDIYHKNEKIKQQVFLRKAPAIAYAKRVSKHINLPFIKSAPIHRKGWPNEYYDSGIYLVSTGKYCHSKLVQETITYLVPIIGKAFNLDDILFDLKRSCVSCGCDLGRWPQRNSLNVNQIDLMKKYHEFKFSRDMEFFICDNCTENDQTKFQDIFDQHTTLSAVKKESTRKLNDFNRSRGRNLLSRDAIADRIKAVYGDKYDYSNLVYTGAKNKIKLSCKKHGVFYKTLDLLENGFGCNKCLKEETKPTSVLTTETVKSRVMEVFGDKYEYDNIRYVNAKTKINITCKKHGPFKALYPNLEKGFGCRECSTLFKRFSNEDKDALDKKYPGLYTYPEIEETLNKSIITAHCIKHNVSFSKKLFNLLRGDCCRMCKLENKTAGNLKQFVENSKKLYGDKFDYSKFIYIHKYYSGIIVCPAHGEFKRTPLDHLNGISCRRCQKEKDSALMNNISMFFDSEENYLV